MIKQVKQLFVDTFGLGHFDEGLFEILLGQDGRQGGQRLGLLVNQAKEVAYFFDWDFIVFGQIGEHFIYFIVGHSK